MIGVMVPSVFTPNEAYADSFNMFAKDAETDEVNGFTELDGARGVDTFDDNIEICISYCNSGSCNDWSHGSKCFYSE